MKTTSALTEFLFARVNWSPQTRVWYTNRLTRFVTWAEAEGVRDTDDLTATLVHRYYVVLRESGLASATLRGHGETIRAWFTWLESEEMLPDKVLKRLEVPKADKLVKTTLEMDELHQLFTAAEKQTPAKVAARDLALLLCLADTGMRAGEIVGLRLDGVSLGRNEAVLLIRGKGAKFRTVGLGRKARTALFRYINKHRWANEGVETVFTNRSGNPMSIRSLERLLDRLAKAAGLERHIHPHLLRHSYARHYLANNGDCVKLAMLLGHESLTVTQAYLRDLRAAEARQGSSILDKMMGQ